jgi:hypothetical protein
VEHRLAALAADPGTAETAGLAIAQDRDRPVHPDPAIAVPVLESWIPLAEHPELRAVDHQAASVRGRTALLSMIPNGCSNDAAMTAPTASS